ncbi:hypothetical protein RS9916_30822 [Synechococcus sp. RS9916]|nr:hypothetical protein RS9916_30822 [Synechococcus sp. RS9916]
MLLLKAIVRGMHPAPSGGDWRCSNQKAPRAMAPGAFEVVAGGRFELPTFGL